MLVHDWPVWYPRLAILDVKYIDIYTVSTSRQNTFEKHKVCQWKLSKSKIKIQLTTFTQW